MFNEKRVEQLIKKALALGAVEINLSGMGLSCIPESIGQLSQLESLDLSGNNISEIPKFIGQLTKLQTLNLSGNNLSEIPQFIGQLAQLKFLFLSENNISELPESIGKLEQLENLDLGGNRLSKVSNEIGRLSQLKILDLGGNNIGTIPEFVCQLTQLQKLYLRGINLSVIPESIGELKNLENLDLGENNLNYIPDSMGHLVELQNLDLSKNYLNDISESFSNLLKIQKLYVSENNLIKFPLSITELIQLQNLDLSKNYLTELPESIVQLKKLQYLNLNTNSIYKLPECINMLSKLKYLDLGRNDLNSVCISIVELNQLQYLDLNKNNLSEIPNSIGQISQLEHFDLSRNNLTELPESIGQLTQLQYLDLGRNSLRELPESIGQLTQLQLLFLSDNCLSSLPESIGHLTELPELNLDNNPLKSELAAAYINGTDSTLRYLRELSAGAVVLNEAKLVLVGEGAVGKSCLLAALSGEAFVKRDSTHGIEIKSFRIGDVKSSHDFMLNAWDFGGQEVYRPTHQLFFSDPAMYLVVWKPREGIQAGQVKQWISLIKHRAPDAKILVVATHGGPGQRQPDIDRQELWDKFGHDTILGFFHVDSQPQNYDKDNANSWLGDGIGIEDLRHAIASITAGFPEVGRRVPKKWHIAWKHLQKKGAYLPTSELEQMTQILGFDYLATQDFVRASHYLGHLVHYENDAILKDIVVLRPDWIAKAISYVLDDKQTRDQNGLVTFARLKALWSDPNRDLEHQYPSALHEVFVQLMERFDIAYKVENGPLTDDSLILVAQLVSEIQPDITQVWNQYQNAGDVEQVQVCRILEDSPQQASANAEGLFYRLIVRFHELSLGRENVANSVHWRRGLILHHDYNGRALLEHVENDIRITVRAPVANYLLGSVTDDIRGLVAEFWKGLQCHVMIPCIEPCKSGKPSLGLFKIADLMESKSKNRLEQPCPLCNEWQNIDSLLLHARTLTPVIGFPDMLAEFRQIRTLMLEQNKEITDLTVAQKRVMSMLDEQFRLLMNATTDESKEGPRLFSFEPVEPHFWDRPTWVSAKFRLVLWCEHSRQPLTSIDGKDSTAGVYEIEIARDWLKKTAPYLKHLIGVLKLALPIAGAGVELALPDKEFKALEAQLNFGEKSLKSALEVGEQIENWSGANIDPELGNQKHNVFQAHDGNLRQLHSWLKAQDPTFGGMFRVQDKLGKYLWVHGKYRSQY